MTEAQERQETRRGLDISHAKVQYIPMYQTKPNSHLVQSGGVWHFQMRVPKDLHAVLPKRKVQQSLETKDIAVARQRRDILVKQLHEQWRDLRLRLGTLPSWLSKSEYEYALALRNLKDIEPHEAAQLLQEKATDLEVEGRTEAASALVRAVEDTPLYMAGEAFLRSSKLKRSTAKAYTTAYRTLAQRFHTVEEVDRAGLLSFLRGYGTTRTDSAIHIVKAAGRSLWRHLDRDTSLWRDLPVTAGIDATPRGVFSEDELRSIYRFATPKIRAAITIALYTGLRRVEVVGLIHDPVARTVSVPLSAAKTASSRRVLPLHDHATGAVQEWLSDPLGESAISMGFAKAMDLAGVKSEIEVLGQRYSRSYHALRHTVASRLTELGVDQHTIGRVLGHAASNVTAMYASKASVDSLRPVIERLDWSNVLTK